MERTIFRYWLPSLAALLLLVTGAPAPAQNSLGTGRGLESNLQQGGTYRNDNTRPRNSLQGSALGDGRALENRLYRSPNYDRQIGRPGARQDAIVTGNTGGLSRFRGEIDYGAVGEFRDSVGGTEVFNFTRQSLPSGPSAGGNNAGQRFGGSSVLRRPGGGVSTGQISGQYQPFGDQSTFDRVDATGLNATRRRQSLDTQLDARQPYSRQTLAVTSNVDGQLLRVDASPLTGLTMRSLEDGPTADGRFGFTRPGEARRTGLAAPAGGLTERVRGLRDSETDQPERVGQLAAGRLEGQPAATARRLEATPLGRDSRLGRADEADGDESEGPEFAFDPGDSYRQLLDQIRRQTGADMQPGGVIEEEGASEDEGSRPRQATVEELVYDLPNLETFAGRDDSLFDNAIRRAEQHMRDGAYFRAERAYREALQYEPRHPLGMIGRIHAQLGAGLYRTAGRGLREVLAKHPELAAARYEFPVLPESGRLQILIGQLEEETEANPDETAAPLLRAYLAYQASEIAIAEEYLRIFQDRAPRDALGRLLHRVWIEGEAVKPDAEGEGDAELAPDPAPDDRAAHPNADAEPDVQPEAPDQPQPPVDAEK